MGSMKPGDKAIWFSTKRAMTTRMVAVVVCKVIKKRALVRFREQNGLVVERLVGLDNLEPVAERRIPDSVFVGLF